MTDHLDDIRAASEKAEQDAQTLMAQKDDALRKVKDRYSDRLRKAVDKAAAAQRRLRDAEATQALAARDDLDDDAKHALADELGLTFEA